MVKYFTSLLVALAFAAPAFAQDVPQFEVALGYANINFAGERHSGFASTQTINLNSWLGFENYLGYYSLGTDPNYGKAHLISIIPAGKLTYRAEKVNPYFSAGIGGSSLQFPQSGVGTGNSLTFRYGGGVDIPFKDSFAIKFDLSRFPLHTSGSWTSATNFSTGLVIKISQ